MMKDFVGDNSTINSVYRVNNDYERNRGIKKNRGSAIIEMTLIMPIILGVIYLYVCLFLFLLDCGTTMQDMAETLYHTAENGQVSGEIESNANGQVQKEVKNSANGQVQKKSVYGYVQQGEKISIYIKEPSGLFDMELEMHRADDDVVERIRRWQLATDTVCARGNE